MFTIWGNRRTSKHVITLFLGTVTCLGTVLSVRWIVTLVNTVGSYISYWTFLEKAKQNNMVRWLCYLPEVNDKCHFVVHTVTKTGWFVQSVSRTAHCHTISINNVYDATMITVVLLISSPYLSDLSWAILVTNKTYM